MILFFQVDKYYFDLKKPYSIFGYALITNKYFVIPIQKFKTYVALDNCRPIVPNLGFGPGIFASELCHLASDLE